MRFIRIGHSGITTWISLKAKFRCRLLDWISKRDMSAQWLALVLKKMNAPF